MVEASTRESLRNEAGTQTATILADAWLLIARDELRRGFAYSHLITHSLDF